MLKKKDAAAESPSKQTHREGGLISSGGGGRGRRGKCLKAGQSQTQTQEEEEMEDQVFLEEEEGVGFEIRLDTVAEGRVKCVLLFLHHPYPISFRSSTVCPS